jgi:5-oxoprolinase (ATP-hydrolysing)
MAEVDTVRAVDYLDDGSPIALALTIDRRDGSAALDFAGHRPRDLGQLQCTVSSCAKSAILYSLRCLIKKDLPAQLTAA